jgi:hypothetical protein
MVIARGREMEIYIKKPNLQKKINDVISFTLNWSLEHRCALDKLKVPLRILVISHGGELLYEY